VLVPVLDRDKHYWISDDEVDKLIRHGEGWLSAHPEQKAIVHRYLKYRPTLTREALARLVDESDDPEAEKEAKDHEEQVVEESLRLHDQRIGAVLSVLKQSGAKRVVDLGCGGGRLLRELVPDPAFTEVVGVDVSVRALEYAQRSLRLDRYAPSVRDRVQLLHGSLMYRDDRLKGFDAAAVVEVIEHFDPPRLRAFEDVVFGSAQPTSVIVTTPNFEYNVRFEGLPAGSLRHRDHRFEWTREELHGWAHGVADRHGYEVRFIPIGPEDPEVGPPSQMAVFHK
jgi:3' terminal RNA ribose 2'-O-methyltransferase Hen1